MERHLVVTHNRAPDVGPGERYAVHASAVPLGVWGLAVFEGFRDPKLLHFLPDAATPVWIGARLSTRRGPERSVLDLDTGKRATTMHPAEVVALGEGWLEHGQQTPMTQKDAQGRVVARANVETDRVEVLEGGLVAALHLGGHAASLHGPELRQLVSVQGELADLLLREGAVTARRAEMAGVVGLAGLRDGTSLVTPPVPLRRKRIAGTFVRLAGRRVVVGSGDEAFVWAEGEARATRLQAIAPPPHGIGEGLTVTDDGAFACAGNGAVFRIAAGSGQEFGRSHRCVATLDEDRRARVELVDLGPLAETSVPITFEAPHREQAVHAVRDRFHVVVVAVPKAAVGSPSSAVVLVAPASEPDPARAARFAFDGPVGGTSVRVAGRRGLLLQSSFGSLLVGTPEGGATPVAFPAYRSSKPPDATGRFVNTLQSAVVDGDTLAPALPERSPRFIESAQGKTVRLADGGELDVTRAPLRVTERPAAETCLEPPGADGRRAGVCDGQAVVAEEGKPTWVAGPTAGTPYDLHLVVPAGIAWKDGTGRRVALPGFPVASIAADSQFLDVEGGVLVIPDRGPAVRVPSLPSARAKVLAISPDGNHLVSPTAIRTLHGKVVVELPEGTTLAAFSPDGKHVAVLGGRGQKLRLYDLATGAIVRSHSVQASTLTTSAEGVLAQGAGFALLVPYDPSVEPTLLATDALTATVVRVAKDVTALEPEPLGASFAKRFLCRPEGSPQALAPCK